MKNLSDTRSKTVLITGAAGGIGRATVKLFAQKGWRVIGVDRATFDEPFPTNGLFIQSWNRFSTRHKLSRTALTRL